MMERIYRLFDKLIDKKINDAVNRIVDERLNIESFDIKKLNNEALALIGEKPLSDREIEVLDLIRIGLNFKEAGEKAVFLTLNGVDAPGFDIRGLRPSTHDFSIMLQGIDLAKHPIHWVTDENSIIEHLINLN